VKRPIERRLVCHLRRPYRHADQFGQLLAGGDDGRGVRGHAAAAANHVGRALQHTELRRGQLDQRVKRGAQFRRAVGRGAQAGEQGRRPVHHRAEMHEGDRIA